MSQTAETPRGIRARVKHAYAETLFRSGLTSVRRRKWPVILHYHRISGEAFDQQMEHLTKWGRAISLEHALACLRGAAPPVRGAVVVTFDDAYRSVCDEIRPVLARHEVPATIYLVSDLVDGNSALWFDLVEWAIFAWGASYFDLLPESLHRAAVPGDSRMTRRMTLGLLRLCQLEERKRLVAEILSTAGLAADHVPDRYRLVDWDEARAMQQAGLVTVGAHTRTHPILTRVSRERAWDEIAGSKARIERELGGEVVHFAYPNGKESDFDAETRNLVADAGYESATSTVTAHARPGVDPYALPRWGVDGDDTLATFAVKIAGLWPAERIYRSSQEAAGREGSR